MRPIWAAAELGLKYELRVLRPEKGETENEPYRKLTTAPCEFGTLLPERAQFVITNEMKDHIRQGFKLVSLTKVDRPTYAPNTCVYTFVRQ